MEKIKTKKNDFVKAKTLIVAIDIGKGFNMGYTRCPDRSREMPFKFLNNRAGFDKFWNILENTKKEMALDHIVVGFESTGAYAEPLQHFLRVKPVQLVQVNPMHTKRLKELQGNSPNKTDGKDPKVIADIIELGHALTVVIPEGAAAELRRLTQARERAIKRRTALYNQLQELVFVSFPEFLQVFKNVKSKSAQYILQNYTIPQEIVKQGLETIKHDLKRVSKGRFKATKAETLFDVAQTSAGIIEGSASISFEVKAILETVTACNDFIFKLEEQMTYYLEQTPTHNLLLSMKGISTITAAGLIGEVGDFNNFTTQRELFKYVGFDLFEISSGKRQGSRRISKRGRPLLRKFLFFAALNTVRKGGIMHAHYQRHLKKGMKRIKALVAIARKLLAIIFALVRTGNEYQEDYHQMQSVDDLPAAA